MISIKEVTQKYCNLFLHIKSDFLSLSNIQYLKYAISDILRGRTEFICIYNFYLINDA